MFHVRRPIVIRITKTMATTAVTTSLDALLADCANRITDDAALIQATMTSSRSVDAEVHAPGVN